MADFSLFTEITGDASGLVAELGRATKSLSSFGSQVGAIAGGFALGSLFIGAAKSVAGFADSMFSTATEFQDFGATFQVMSENITGAINDTTDGMGGMAGKASTSALEMEDVLITHKQRLEAINSDIAEVMKGGDILKAQKDLNSSLEDLAYTHTQKMKSFQDDIDSINSDLGDRKLRRQEDSDRVLADMETSHQEDVASKKVKFEESYKNAQTRGEKSFLKQKFEEQSSLEEQDFKTKYERKKQQEQAKMDLETQRDQEQAQKRIKQVQDQIAKENEEYNRQQSKLKADSEERIKTMEAENAKKLALYQQELDNEERTFKLHMAKMKEAGGGSGSESGTTPGFASADDPFRAQKQSGAEVMGAITKIAQANPLWDDADFLKAAQGLRLLGSNAEAVLPNILNIAGATRKSITETADLLQTGMVKGGRALTQLSMQLGISKSDLLQYGVEFDKQGKIIDQGAFWSAISKINEIKFAGGMEAQANTLNGAVRIIKNTIGDLAKDFLDISDNGTIKKGGIFDSIQTSVKSVADYLLAHREEIVATIKNVATSVAEATKDFVNWLKSLQPLWDFITKFIVPVLKFLAVEVLGNTVMPVLKQFMEGLTALVSIADKIVGAFKKVGDVLGGVFNDIKNKAKDAFSYIDPFARHSPSLVDNVTSGVEVIKDKYLGIGKISYNMPSIAPAYSNSSVQNNSSVTHAPNVQMNNVFNVKGQANASNIAKYLSFQMEHQGLF